MSLVPYKVTAIKKTDPTGNNVLPFASVAIVKSGGGYAQLWDDEAGTIARANPFQVDANGERQVWLNGGDYNVSVAGGQSWDIKLTGGSDILSIENVAALSTFTPVVGQLYRLKEYNSGTGKGGGDLLAKSGSITPNNVTTFSSGTAGVYFERVNYRVDAETGGVNSSDDSTDYTSRIVAISQAERDIEIFGDINLESSTAVDLGNVNFSGDAELKNVVRKYSAPIIAPYPQPFNNVFPELQLRRLNTEYKPRVVIVGDSLSTSYANVWGRGDMLAESLRQSLNAQFPQGVTWINRAIAGSGFSELFSTNYANTDYLPWYQGMPTTTWINVVEMDAPDLIIVAFGMNDNQYASVNGWVNLENEIATWAVRPDICVVTNPVPNPASTSPNEGVTGQVARDMAAGLNRSYALNKRWALIDMHRMYCMARDGFDPTSAVINQPQNITASAGNIVGGLCQHWKARFLIAGGTFANGEAIRFSTGRGTADFIILSKVDATTMGVSAYAGIGAVGVDDAIEYVGTSAAFTWPTSNFYLTVEFNRGKLLVYRDDDARNGGYYPNIYELNVIAMGGEYDFFATGPSGKLLSAEVGYGEYLLNKPTVRNSQLFDGGVIGGSAWNHPSGFYATNVIRPVLDNVRWKRARKKRGYFSVTAGATSATVTFAVAEPNANYEVLVVATDADPGKSFGVNSKTASGFTVQFLGGITFTTTFLWELILRQE